MKPNFAPLFPPWRGTVADRPALERIGITKGTTETVRQIEQRCAISRQQARYDRAVVWAIVGWSCFGGSVIAHLLGLLR